MARERYLLGAGEDTIHTGVIELKTAKERRKNWWYYHKTHVLAGVVLAAVVVSAAYSILSQVEPDYTIGMITSFQFPGELLEQMEDHIAQFAEDRNGDGKVVVELSSYVFSDSQSMEDWERTQANFTRMTGDAIANTCMVYLAEEEGFLQVAGDFMGFFQYEDGSPMPDEAEDFENAMRPVSDFPGLTSFEPDLSELDDWSPEVVEKLLSRLNVMVRTCEGVAFAKNEKEMDYYTDSLALLERLENPQPAEP